MYNLVVFQKNKGVNKEKTMEMSQKKKILFTRIAFAVAALAAAVALVLTGIGIARVVRPAGSYTYVGDIPLFRETTAEEEDYSADEDTVCPVRYVSEDETYAVTVNYTYEEWEALGDSNQLQGKIYKNSESGREIVMPKESTADEISAAVRNENADLAGGLFGLAMAVGLFAVGLFIMAFFGKFFSLYEKIWFLSILILAAVFSIIFPEESCNGINGIVIMGLYLLDTFLNILCELLISKQSRWNFIVSLFVEVTEILICVVLAYRFATMLSTLLFWIPCDIVSFVNWNRKKDDENDDVTKVRTLKGWQEVLLIVGIVVWTAGIGYLLTLIDLGTDIFGGNEVLKVIVCYLDACASVVGILNGLAILFRFREQWIAWYICAALEAVINILAGQYVLLVLKFGYITNTTYGYIKWTKYIKEHPQVLKEKTVF